MNATAEKIDWTPSERSVFAKLPDLTVSQNAERSRIVTRGPKKGPWRNITTPYAISPMDAWNDPWVQKIILRFAPQVAKTQIALNCLLYAIEHDPADALYVMPDEKVAKRISKKQIIPMLRSSPAIAPLLSPFAADTSTLAVKFMNGMDLTMAWASSAAELASEAYRYGLFDETAKYPKRASGELGAVELGEIRTRTFRFIRKLMYFSSPNLENDALHNVEQEADVNYYYKAKCPYCGHVQRMVFKSEDGYRIVWPKGAGWRVILRKNLAQYQCENCVVAWNDSQRDRAVQLGLQHGWNGWHTEDKVERPQAVAFHLPSWYSPFVSLSEDAAAFLKGKNDLEKHKVWITQHRADYWRQIVVKSSDEEILKAKCGLENQMVPDSAVALSAGIDVQKTGFWFVVRAWAADFTSWLIHYGHLSTWDDVETLLFESKYPVADRPDEFKTIWRAGIDTGGGKKYEDMSMTEETELWVRANATGRGCRVYATKGSSRPLAGKCHAGKPRDKTPSGKPLPGGLQIISIDTEKGKDTVYYRLKQAAEQKSYAAYLHKDTGTDYAGQITAERKERDPKTGIVAWVEKRRDNHLLDAEVLAHMVVDPEWPGGGLNLVRTPETTGKVSKPRRRVRSKGIRR